MRIASNALLLLTVALLLAAIWLPGAWWQWLLTAIVVVFAAGYCGSQADK